jgi:hypothetical protein
MSAASSGVNGYMTGTYATKLDGIAAGAGINPIPTGTVILFYQSAAPTGWTQVTTLNDYGLRLVSGAGGTTAGTTAFSTVFANQTPSFTGSIGSLAGGATTLSTAQMPSHTHGYFQPAGGARFVGDEFGPNNTTTGGGSSTTDAQGGGGSHSHSISGTPGGTVGAVTLNVRYANIIICSKN